MCVENAAILQLVQALRCTNDANVGKLLQKVTNAKSSLMRLEQLQKMMLIKKSLPGEFGKVLLLSCILLMKTLG